MNKEVSFSLDEFFLSQIDTLAKFEHSTRSELIRQALRVYIRAKENEALRNTLLVL